MSKRQGYMNCMKLKTYKDTISIELWARHYASTHLMNAVIHALFANFICIVLDSVELQGLWCYTRSNDLSMIIFKASRKK